MPNYKVTMGPEPMSLCGKTELIVADGFEINRTGALKLYSVSTDPIKAGDLITIAAYAYGFWLKCREIK